MGRTWASGWLVLALLAGVAGRGMAGEVWVSDIHNQTDGEAAGKPEAIVMVGARNGCFSGKVVAGGSAPKAKASELKGPGGVIPEAEIRIRYGHPWQARNERWQEQEGKGPMACLAEAPPEKVPADKRCPVWMTVHVPKTAKPGDYSGTLTVGGKKVPVKLKVVDWALPDPVDYRTWVDIIQAPDTTSLEYGVPLWSDQHWQMIERSFKLLGEVGNKTVYVPLIGHTNFGHDQAMVRWIKKGPNQYEYDFTVMDQYLDLAQKHLVKPSAVVFLVWEMYMIPEAAAIPEEELRKLSAKDRPFSIGEARQAMEIKQGGGRLGLGPLVPVVAAAGQKPENAYLPLYTKAESKALWAPLLVELRKRLAARGWADAMMLGLFSDTGATKEELAFFDAVAKDVPWVIQSHYGIGGAADRKFRGSLVGYDTRVWGAVRFADGQKQTNQREPVTAKAMYGWSRPDLVAIYERNAGLDGYPLARWRFFAETCITGDQRGIGRLGGDFWYCLRDKRGRRAADPKSRYPEADRRNLDLYSSILAAAPEGPAASDRFEAFREGVQECEARIAIEWALMDNTRRAKLGADLADRAQRHLDDRLAYMWKSLSKDLNQVGVLWRWNPGVAGHQWFLQEGKWQERSEQLYTLAGEVEKKVGKPVFGKK